MPDPWTTHTLDLADDALAGLEREWLLTGGTGAYAMGTVAACPTRRYHGLFVAATQPPTGRVVTLSQMWEQLLLEPARAGGSTPFHSPAVQSLEFATLRFRSQAGRPIYAPQGYQMLDRFERGLSAKWSYTWGRIGFERELILHWKQQAATLRYTVTGLDAPAARATLRLEPMLALRDFHALRRGGAPGFESPARDTLRVGEGTLWTTLHCPGAKFQPGQHWWYAVHYPLDAERGQEDTEDLFVPGRFEIELPPAASHEVTVTIALGDEPADPAPVAIDEHPRAAHLAPIRDHLARTLPSTATPRRAAALTIAADDFVVDRDVDGPRSTIIAGYPWFADWGRDTFIALPGLMLVTGRAPEARRVLEAFAARIRDGLVPNRFDDYNPAAAHYNTVDASLWFIHAAMRYLDATSDNKTWNDWLAHACIDIIEHYQRGTGGGDRRGGGGGGLIHMDDDGLITAGHSGTQLTWMDAACGDVVFTPRAGKAVEINALWHSALVGLAKRFARRKGERQQQAGPAYAQLAERVCASFNDRFWNEREGWLYDHLWADASGQPHHDLALRPNQIFAVALEHSPLEPDRQRQVVVAVRDHLLTPVGLRTLPADDPAYHAHYTGDQFHRDEAYHQGTIWPWLIGPYAEAVLRAGDFSDDARREAREAITPLLDRLLEQTGQTAPAGDPARTHPLMRDAVGQLHEIHEADPHPATGDHRPVGCPAQAWSIAELLRVAHLLES
ncbi:MAG: amylo-alpha-1,6-glucosidase [Phycisphaeraceae bacterium]